MRLKLGRLVCLSLFYSFQKNACAIEAIATIAALGGVAGFRRTLVRLKLCKLQLSQSQKYGFRRTLVRLKRQTTLPSGTDLTVSEERLCD